MSSSARARPAATVGSQPEKDKVGGSRGRGDETAESGSSVSEKAVSSGGQSLCPSAEKVNGKANLQMSWIETPPMASCSTATSLPPPPQVLHPFPGPTCCGQPGTECTLLAQVLAGPQCPGRTGLSRVYKLLATPGSSDPGATAEAARGLWVPLSQRPETVFSVTKEEESLPWSMEPGALWGTWMTPSPQFSRPLVINCQGFMGENGDPKDQVSVLGLSSRTGDRQPDSWE